MVNYDYPGICMACVEERCDVTPPDLSLTRERVHQLTQGYVLDLVNDMTNTFPEKFSGPEEAYQIVDILKMMIVNGLKIHSAVEMEGIGVWRTSRAGALYDIEFVSDPKLVDHHHDTTPPDADKARELAGQVRGSTRNILRTINDTFPDKIQSMEEAFRVYYFIRAKFANELYEGRTVEIDGIGKFEPVDKDGGKSVQFTPMQVLEAAVNE